MKSYSVKQLAQLAGVSVRTLHVYDAKGLLQPAFRTEAGYRMYTESELLRLQQILFYRELDVRLQEIKSILDDPTFNELKALSKHKAALLARQKRMRRLIKTIDKTIAHLKKENMMTSHEELYAGFPKGKKYRAEAMEKWGKKTVAQSEKALLKLSKDDFAALKDRFADLWQRLYQTRKLDPASAEVQTLIKYHYDCITQFWGRPPSAEAYIGLGEMYVSDERYTTINDQPQPEFAVFLKQAMTHFARQLPDRLLV